MTPIEQFEIDFNKPAWPTAEMIEHARKEFTDEALCVAWAGNGDWEWWHGLHNYEQHAWMQRYLCAREDAQQTAWRNARRMWSCECPIGYGRRLKHRGTRCERCGSEIVLRLQPRPVAMKSPRCVLGMEEESYRHNLAWAEQIAEDLRRDFKEGRPCSFKPAPGFEWLLDWAFLLAQVPQKCLAPKPKEK